MSATDRELVLVILCKQWTRMCCMTQKQSIDVCASRQGIQMVCYSMQQPLIIACLVVVSESRDTL